VSLQKTQIQTTDYTYTLELTVNIRDRETCISTAGITENICIAVLLSQKASTYGAGVQRMDKRLSSLVKPK
jgi:hypothetical protein